MPNYSYPTNEMIMEIEQELMPRLMADRPIFKFCTIESLDYDRVAWEQEDNYSGLQELRGYDGPASKVNAAGLAKYNMAPGIYGDYMTIDEEELTKRRQTGTFGTPIKIDDLVMKRSAHLQLRFLDRVESTLWNSLQGSYQVSSRNGRLVVQDTFSVNKVAATYAWSNTANATPLIDLRSIELLGRGQSASFGSDAEVWMNRRQANYMLANTNPLDLYSKRPTGLSTILSIDQLNLVLSGEGLPQVRVYDQGYLPAPAKGQPALRSSFIPFIPDGTVIAVAKRPGNARVASYLMTRNAQNPDGAPGQYSRVIDLGERQVPRELQVHNGHNGGPAIFYPGAVAVLAA